MRKKEKVYYVSTLGKIDNSLRQKPYTDDKRIIITVSDIFEMIGEQGYVFYEQEYEIRRERITTRTAEYGYNGYVLYKNNELASATDCIEFLNYYFEIAHFDEIQC